MLMAGITGCKKYTEEYNPGNRTAETYYNTNSGFQDLAKSNYATLRSLISFPGLLNIGTDVYSTAGINDNNGFNLYNSQLNSTQPDLDNFFRQLYADINIANNTIYWATQVTDGDPAIINARVGEAKALRAWYYYLLVEMYGDVPLVTTRTTGITLTYTRTPEKDVYTQIVQDLNEAISALPATTPDFGRVTKGFAQHLLAKVYLTRGYKSYAAADDFQQAATLADAVINSGTYQLKPNYSDLFDPSIAGFQVNNEVIFSVQYSTNALTNGAGNSLHQWFLWDTQNTPLVGRSTYYGKTLNAVSPDPYFFSLFNRTSDSRFAATAFDGVITQVAGKIGDKNFAVGDTLIYYPAVAFTPGQKAQRKYLVINPDEYRNSPFLAGARNYPQFKKFRDPFVTTYAENAGARDTYVFRLSETYLIAAEAYVKLGNQGLALARFNAIRTRAAKQGTNPATGAAYSADLLYTGTLTLDAILDERARELAGEEFRWYELKRVYETPGNVSTNKLLTRAIKYNDELKAASAGATTLDAKFLLRPIPQSMIDLNRGAFPQNPGY